jgi:hypothetical protein
LNNTEYISKLNGFIDSKRPEWSVRGGEYCLSDLSLEKQEQANSLRRAAAELVLKVTEQADDSLAWKRLSAGTKFTAPANEPAPGSLEDRLERMLNGSGASWWYTDSEYSEYWCSGKDIRDLYRRDAQRELLHSWPDCYAKNTLPTFEDTWR